jgi:hypothetical protein
VIHPGLSDNLSDGLRIFLIIVCDSDDSVTERKIVCRKQSYSESQEAPRKVTIVTGLQM